MEKIKVGQLLYDRISRQFAKAIEFSYGSENVVEYTIKYEDGDICIFDENELYDLDIGFAKELDKSTSIESGKQFILRRDLIFNKCYGDNAYFVDGMFENIITVDKKRDDGFFIKENLRFYTIKMCSHEFIPLSQINLGEEIKKQQSAPITGCPTFEFIKNNPVDIPQPKFALYTATDQDIINFINQKEKLYLFGSDGSLIELVEDDEIGFMGKLYESKELYTLKTY